MKTHLGNWLSALCAILLVVLLVLQTKQKNQLETLRQEHQAFVSATEQRQQEARDAVSKLTDQVATVGTNLESRLVQDEQQANEKLGATLNMVQQNTAVMHRALGKVIPVELPESLTNELAALEAHIADENSWPKDSTNADAMIAEMRDLVRQIPPWAEDDLLLRLYQVTPQLSLSCPMHAVNKPECVQKMSPPLVKQAAYGETRTANIKKKLMKNK